MQISAANLLLAAQQSAAARPRQTAGADFASAMAAAKPARFSPASFDAPDDVTKAQKPAAPSSTNSKPAASYGAAGGLGSLLDISI